MEDLWLFGIAAGLVFGAGVPLALAPLLEEGLPLPAIFAIYPSALAEAALTAGRVGATYNAVAAVAAFALVPVVRRLGFPAAFWAYTYGAHWRLQPGESPTPYPEFRAVIG